MDRDGQELSLHVAESDFEGTPHEGFDCGDCHAGLDEDDLPHADPIPPAVMGCLDCHDDLVESHLFHRGFTALDEESILREDLRCTGCHGAHRILASDHAEYPFGNARQIRRCGICHEEQSLKYLHCAHARALDEEMEMAPTCIGCHTSDLVVEAQSLDLAHHKAMLADFCISCHVENPEVSGQTLYGTPFITSYERSVHGKALFEGNENAPTCISCHDSHSVGRASDQESAVSRGRVVSQCSQCHAREAEDYLHSIHATVLAKGYRDAPVCTDCHGEHNIMAHSDPDSPVAPANMAEQVCGECHGSVRLAERYGMEADRLDTFEDSFHGLATRGGAVEAVNCASCHAYHDVRACDDPESWVHPDNLAATCGHCHEGANERFAMGKVHVSLDTQSEEPVLYWIATIYIWGIFLIVGGMVIHNALDFFHKVRLKATYQNVPPKQVPDGTPHRLYLRMTVNERIQHAALALSFIILVLTGFMLRYPEAWWVEGLRNLNSHIFELRGVVHRVAGVVMCLSGLWHIGYISLTVRGRQVFKDILPRWKDLSDMKMILRYNLGLSKERPLFARFSYIEKTEYWALIWGSVLMTVTGFLLWYENLTIGMLTKLGFDISRTIHFYEAVLATLAIIVWHFYFVIFNPDVYPMNLSWLTGKMSEEEMETEHPLELERLKKEGESEVDKPSQKPPA
jgi:cytochrome b subunit of formate dehydrogenase